MNLKLCMRLLLIILVVTVVLSFVFHVPYIYTLVGFAGWAFLGHLVTADDDMPGGWSNPDGEIPFPLGELIIKFAIFTSLLAGMLIFPQIQLLGK